MVWYSTYSNDECVRGSVFTRQNKFLKATWETANIYRNKGYLFKYFGYSFGTETHIIINWCESYIQFDQSDFAGDSKLILRAVLNRIEQKQGADFTNAAGSSNI